MPKILIGTTDTLSWDTLAAELSGLGHDPVWACTGMEVLELGNTEAPHLIFLSPTLPIFDGYETCTQLREDPEFPREINIYLLSDDEINPHKLEKAGFTGTFPETHAQHTLQELLGTLAWPA